VDLHLGTSDDLVYSSAQSRDNALRFRGCYDIRGYSRSGSSTPTRVMLDTVPVVPGAYRMRVNRDYSGVWQPFDNTVKADLVMGVEVVPFVLHAVGDSLIGYESYRRNEPRSLVRSPCGAEFDQGDA
jgi:hypothetical protein